MPSVLVDQTFRVQEPSVKYLKILLKGLSHQDQLLVAQIASKLIGRKSITVFRKFKPYKIISDPQIRKAIALMGSLKPVTFVEIALEILEQFRDHN